MDVEKGGQAAWIAHRLPLWREVCQTRPSECVRARRGHGAKFARMTDHRKGLREATSQGARQAARNYVAENPGAQGLRVKTAVAAYKPRSKEIRNAGVKAVYMLLSDRSNLTKSNAAIAAEIGRDLGVKVPANILTERLKAKQLASIKELFDHRKVKLDLAVYDTPSKIKKALKGRGKATEADARCVVEVAFSNDAVTVGNRTYPIQRGDGVPRIHVGKSSKLNVEVLKRLLCDPT